MQSKPNHRHAYALFVRSHNRAWKRVRRKNPELAALAALTRKAG